MYVLSAKLVLDTMWGSSESNLVKLEFKWDLWAGRKIWVLQHIAGPPNHEF